MAHMLSNDSIFLHTPKTGGTWIRSVLNDIGVLRGKLPEFSRAHPEAEKVHKLYPHHVSFAFVRYPLSWLASQWCDLKRMKGKVDTVIGPLKELNYEDTFEVYIREYLTKCSGEISATFKRCTEGCTFVGKYERLKEDLIKALHVAGYTRLSSKQYNTIEYREEARVTELAYRNQAYASETLALHVLQAESIFFMGQAQYREYSKWWLQKTFEDATGEQKGRWI